MTLGRGFRILMAVAALLAVISASLEYPRAATKRKPYKPKLRIQGDLVEHPVWGIDVRIPGYEPWKKNPHLAEPKLVMAATSSTSCDLNLTMWAELVPDGSTAEECRRGYAGNPETLRKRKDVRLRETESSPITYSLFEQSLDDDGRLVQNQLYGYWVRRDHCFELHVSSINCGDFPRIAIPILQSVRILEDTGATLDTIALAQREGGDPRDWQLHGVVAGLYLHRVDPPDTARARRHYLSALQLGGSSVDPRNRWLYEEGIALSWLMQNEGPPGIPHLAQALRLAKSTPELQEVVAESMYNLSCAHALAGEIEPACQLVREMFEKLDEAGRAPWFKSMQEDPQLESLRRSECYRKLLEDFGPGTP